MNKMQIRYFEEEDVLHMVIADGPEVTVELNDQNEVIGIEILDASVFLRDSVLDSIQARTLQLIEAEPA
jgi:uncharacterized protein YuzE